MGDPEGYLYARSSAKPFQALPLVLSGAADALGLTDEELLRRLRALVAEARDYHAGEDFPAAMARVRVAQDLVDLRIVALSEG